MRLLFNHGQTNMMPACELSNADIASRIVDLMRGNATPDPFLQHYADCIEKAASLDDLSLVRRGKKAEALEEGFRYFAAGFPGAPAVTVPEGELFRMGTYLARVDPKLRRTLLIGWCEIIRSKV